ncbi:MAG: hypothetical protein GC181_13915 [Bacteroidetes bacterium]|nr:hypothetical protein [Bacteroidota bacterium]
MVFLLSSVSVFAQETGERVHRNRDGQSSSFNYTKTKVLHLGYNGFGNHYGEIGISWNRLKTLNEYQKLRAFQLGAEVGYNKNVLLAPKISIWRLGNKTPLLTGLNGLYYTNFIDQSIRIRPEIGFAFRSAIRVLYGYNFPVNGGDLKFINNHNICLSLLIGEI